ncbi:MAG: 5-formyltetrahydrofolate cyclo-ligase [Mycobacterium sp.]|nr:5-formyltetrahydrofolate cyclo-ligase [Mycobacterium sp.]MDT5190612.1 5-formyltetrahydrofolate cyclo-ligase [Mycobacterium sp.]MDT5195186.1 5-formyltetrahydrofolate cyclo-ligase [Mycobacterium sp.]MDT5239553.1 5-formyltetrahydrofolate cyclo-ligase [Mycobacterium sp.]MDT5266910.1 5-formyltetrahydrofolate cyclo-ligase [Mycobacterium sp.]
MDPTTKAEWREAVLRARRLTSPAQRRADADALCGHLPALVHAGDTVCAYLPVGSEPGSTAMLDALAGLGVRVLLPVAREDEAGFPLPLQWGEYRAGGLVDARFGLREPGPPWLGVDAIASASVVLVPALAVDLAGVRLGRGAGFYDRSLSSADPAALLVAVVRDDELVDLLPGADHDVPMTHALTPGLGLVALRAHG